jgi:hypothetical protein
MISLRVAAGCEIDSTATLLVKQSSDNIYTLFSYKTTL